MGVFNTVHYMCPHCHLCTSDQTKLTDGYSAYYVEANGETDLPCDLKEALLEQQQDEPLWCEHCSGKFRLQLVTRPTLAVVPVY